MTVEELRMIERLIGVSIGGMALFLGYRLFSKDQLSQKGEITIFDQIKIKAMQFGPGLFFALFGAWVVNTSLKSKVETSGSTSTSKDSLAEEKSPKKGSRFSGAQASHAEVHNVPPVDVIKAINSVSVQVVEYLDSNKGQAAAEVLRAHKKSLTKVEWASSPSLVEEFFSFLDQGLEIPKDRADLKQVNDTYEAIFP